MKVFLTKEAVRAAVQEIVKQLHHGFPFKAGNQIVYNVFVGELTERKNGTNEEIGKVYFGHLLFITTDQKTFQRNYGEMKAFIHSKGEPIVEFHVKDVRQPNNKKLDSNYTEI